MNLARNHRYACTVAVVAIAAASIGVASAQTAPSPAAPAQDEQAAPAAGAEGLQDIVVTAQRRSENLQRAAISVTAVSPEELARASVTTAANLTAVVPALQASNQAGYTAFFIRGIGSGAYNPYTEPAVAFNLNGVYISRPNAVNGQFYDVERVEVLKGPQGTLYGRNASGGAVNLLTRKPELGQFDGYVGAEYGNYNEVLANGAVNLPLGDKGAIRAAFQTEDHDGYYRDGTDDAKSRSFRVSMRAEPTPDLSFNIVGDYSFLGGRGGGAALLPLGTTPVRGGLGDPAVTSLFQNLGVNRFIFPGAATPIPQYLARLDTKTGGVMAEVTVRTPIGSLTILPAYRELSTDNFSTTPGYWVVDRSKQHQTSIEARLASQGNGRIGYLLGGYYFDEKSDFLIQPDIQFIGVVNERGRLGTKTAAAFGQLTYHLTDTIRLTGGLRYTWERKALDGTHGLSVPAVFTSGPGLQPLVTAPPVPQIIVDARRTFTSTTWKAGIEWDAGPRSLVYANAGTGFKAGGFFFAQDNNSYNPERVTSYVLGSKNRFFDNKLQLNVEGFLLKYKDQQLSSSGFVDGINGPVSGFPTENVGRSTIYGSEADVQYLLTASLLVGIDANYVHSKLDAYVYNAPDISPLVGLAPGALPPSTGCRYAFVRGSYTIDCSGQRLTQTPVWSLGGHVRETVELSGGASIVAEVRSRFETSRLLSESYLPVTRVGDNTRTDATLSFTPRSKVWSITAYVNNIENKDVATNAFLHDVYPLIPVVVTTLRPPRTFGVRGQINF